VGIPKKVRYDITREVNEDAALACAIPSCEGVIPNCS
jgi:hypothetical protein